MILGLTGSLGSGKSMVASQLESLGAVVVRADDLAREAVRPGYPAFREIVALFGPQVVAADGWLDRKKLAQVVFSDPERRRRLEQIVHPIVREREREEIARHEPHELVVLEIPLLFETGAQELCDRVCVVTVPEDVRLQRLRQGRGMSEQEIAARLSAQLAQDEKVARADYVIDNGGSREATREQVERLFRELMNR